MAKKKRTSRAKSSKRALNALELAEKAVRGYGTDSDSDDNDYKGRVRGKKSSRRSNVVNLLKKVEGKGSDSEDGDQDFFEDEELDSDEVFGSDEEFDVMDSKFSQTLRDLKKKNGDDYELDIDEDGGYTSIDEDDLMSLSQVWDMDEKSHHQSESDEGISDKDMTKSEFKLNDEDMSSQSDGSSESSSEDSEEESGSESDPFDEISKDEDEIKLDTITKNLLKDDEKISLKKLDNYGGGEENEFNLPAMGSSDLKSNNLGSSNKLKLSDMMSVIDDQEAVSKATLIKDNNKMIVDVPLPQRIQQRHERKAAYEISKDEVNRWNDVVKQNRRQEHLSFPLNAPVQHNESTTFSRTDGKAKTELETKVQAVLEESNLVDPQKESTFEELATATITPEELSKRTAERRLMRELMFREERKAKRLKKIKSKAFHRIKKKEMLRNKELAGVSNESDEEQDIARARERMTLKHKSNNKWAKDMVKHGMANDVETREEIEEMFRQSEKLRKKVLDKKDGQSDDEKGLSDLEREQEEESSTMNDESNANDKFKKSGVMNMAFMKNAEAREREDNKQMMSKLRNAQDSENIFLFNSDDEKESNNENRRLNTGRRIYTPGNLQAKEELNNMKQEILEEQAIDESQTLVNRLLNKRNTNKKNDIKEEKFSKAVSNEKTTQEPENEVVSNPWLDDNSEDETYTGKQSSKVSVIDIDSTAERKAIHKLAKHAAKVDAKSRHNKNKNRDDDLLLNMEASNRLQLNNGFDGSDVENDSNDHGLMFKQQEVISEAFAGDNVVAEFEEDKKRTALDEDDKEEDVTLPGWGDWTGAGARPKKKRKFIKKIQGVVTKDKRKDKNLNNVIINEKVNKKNLKYQSSSVPFPYESREQYERSLRMPIGQEWTSRASHQKMIKPRITTKPGEVIDPLKAPFK